MPVYNFVYCMFYMFTCKQISSTKVQNKNMIWTYKFYLYLIFIVIESLKQYKLIESPQLYLLIEYLQPYWFIDILGWNI